QYGLVRLLRRLGAGIADVEELAVETPRTHLLRAALAPAEQTTQWGVQRRHIDVVEALKGVSIIAAPGADLEARAVALAARQAVLDRQTVGIVSRDQILARRIAAELHRHGIDVDDPAGTPLYQASAGRLARQVLAVACGQFAPVDLIALLRNAAVTLGRERTLPGLTGVLALAEIDELRDLLSALGEALAPVTQLVEQPEIDAGRLAAALEQGIAALIGTDASPGMLEFRDWAQSLAAQTDAGTAFAPVNLDGVLAALMEGSKVPPAERRRDDVHIWGEL